MKYSVKIGWLYPELMSTYGDRGNILVLQKRCLWRGIEAKIVEINEDSTAKELESVDLIFGGGAQDREQELVIADLRKKRDSLAKKIEENVPALFVCGAPQLLGKFYEPESGNRIEGLGIFDMRTVHPGHKSQRLIGNIIARVNWSHLPYSTNFSANKTIVGFENHGGRTKLGKSAVPFAHVISGHGNNDEDKTEGVIHKNAIGCYFHGPLLPKNPQIADWLISTALRVKYDDIVPLPTLDDTLSDMARGMIAEKMGVKL